MTMVFSIFVSLILIFVLNVHLQENLLLCRQLVRKHRNRNFKLIQQLANWTDKDGTGIGFDSSAGFILPNGATRSPDVSWIKLTRWNVIPDEQKATSVTSFGGFRQRRGLKFAPICPDFVVEIRSPSDSLKPLKDKMQEYIDNGTSTGWLIDRKNRKVYVYQPNRNLECLNNPKIVVADSLLTGFELDLTKIW